MPSRWLDAVAVLLRVLETITGSLRGRRGTLIRPSGELPAERLFKGIAASEA